MAKLPFWIWVPQARSAGVALILVGSGHVPPDNGVEISLITPVLSFTPVSGFFVKSVSTESVRSPSGERKQLQHSESSWLASHTKMLAQTFPVAVPGFVNRTVASGAPAVLALAKYSTLNVSAGGVVTVGSPAHADVVHKARANVHTTSSVVRRI